MGALTELAFWMMPSELMPRIGVALLLLSGVMRVVNLGSLSRLLMVSAVALIAIPLVLEPVMGQLFSQMPTWLLGLIIVATGLYLFRLVLSVFLGKKAATVTTGSLVAKVTGAVITGTFGMIRGLIRLLFRRKHVHAVSEGKPMKSRLFLVLVMPFIVAMGWHIDPAGAANLLRGAGKEIGTRAGARAGSMHHSPRLAKQTEGVRVAEAAALKKELEGLDQKTLARIEEHYGAVIPHESLQRAKVSKSVFLNRDTYQRQLRDHYPDMSEGQIQHVMGNYVHGTSYVNANQVLVPRVMAHERVHQLSHPRFRAEMGARLDEGVTEHLASKIYGDLSIRGMEASYSRSRPIARLLETRVGERRLAQAYFQGDSALIRNELDRQLGRDASARIVRAMDAGDFTTAERVLIKGVQ